MTEKKTAVTTVKQDLATRILYGTIAAAMIGVLITTYQNSSKMAQFMVDHIHAHDIEETACAAYRQTMRRELDQIWFIVNSHHGQKAL